MPSHQQSKDQERAARAWDDVNNCFDKAKSKLENDLQKIKAQPPDERDFKWIKELESRLSKLQKEEEKFRAGYGRQAKRIPAQIQTNGLGQTLAFLRSKGKEKHEKEHQAVYNDLSEWVTGQMGWQGSDLLSRILKSDSITYRRATSEAIAYLTWLKRFAEAELLDEEGSE